MSLNDDKLSALLKQWHDVKPRANFETDVWRRIRLAEATQPQRALLGDVVREWLRRPAYVSAFAVMIGLSIGLWAGALSMARSETHAGTPFQFLSEGTLARSYAQLSGRVSR